MSSIRSLPQIIARGGKEVATSPDGWTLFVYGRAMGSEWTSIYLRRAGRRSVGSVRSAIAGWNGERLSAGRDVAALPEHVRQWAIGVMSGLPK